jgi:FixJ family two-component response regulator
MRRTSCLVLDAQLPGMNGFKLQRQLFEKGTRVPIIFLTASHDEWMQKAALAAVTVDFLHKPVSDEALLKGIRSALRLREPEEQNS